MNKIYLSAVLLFIILLMTGCPQMDNSDGDSSNNNSGTRDDIVIYEGTGSVSGTVNEDAVVILEQSDGTIQQTETTESDPDFVFENVPVGDSSITIQTDDDEVTQDIVVVTDEDTQINPFGSTQEMADSLTVKVYAMPSNSSSVSQMTDQIGSDFYSKQINVPERAFDEGFPGVTDRFEWFGLVYDGQIKAPVNGTYNFKVKVDDGAILYISQDDTIDADDIVIDADGLHAPTEFTGSIDLEAGEIYYFRLKYFQGPKNHICLVLKSQIPGADMILFDMDDYTE